MSGLSAKIFKILKTHSKSHSRKLTLVPARLGKPALEGDIAATPPADEPTPSPSTLPATAIEPTTSPTKRYTCNRTPAKSIKAKQAPKSQSPPKKVRLEDEIPVNPKMIATSITTAVKVPQTSQLEISTKPSSPHSESQHSSEISKREHHIIEEPSLEETSLGQGPSLGSVDLNLSFPYTSFSKDQGIDFEAQDDLSSSPRSSLMVRTELPKDMPNPDPQPFEVGLRG